MAGWQFREASSQASFIPLFSEIGIAEHMQQTPSECHRGNENGGMLRSEGSLDEIYHEVSFRHQEALNQVRLTGNVHWHLFDLSAVELLNLSHHSNIILSDKVDSNTFSAETTTTTDSVNVVFAVSRKVVVDDERDLLHVDATSQKIGGDEDTRRTRAELLHDHITLGLLHVAVHSRDSEVTGSELVGKPVNLSSCVAEDDCLGDGDGFIEIGKGVQLPVLLLHSNVELLDTLESELSFLDQDADWVAHELCGDFKDVLWHCSGKKDHLCGLRKELEDVVDLLGESALT